MVPNRATRFPDKVRNYLQEKFDVGYAIGHKADPVQVSTDMRCARDELGKKLFAASECHSRSVHFSLGLPQYRERGCKAQQI